MTDPQETSENIQSLAHSDANPDPITERGQGSDVGGPAQTTQGATENALVGSGDGSPSESDEPESQSTNPA